MEKVQHKAQARDSPSRQGISSLPKFNINDIPNDVIVARASKLGVSLGGSPSQVHDSINHIKDVDLHRTLIMLKRNKMNAKQDDPGSLVLNNAYKHSEDLLQEELVDTEVHKEPLVNIVVPSRASKKKGKESSVPRRSSRLKKKPIT